MSITRLVASVVIVVAVAGCSGTGSLPTRTSATASASRPVASTPPAGTKPRADLLLSKEGVGPTILIPHRLSGKVYTLRLTCLGVGKTELRSVGGGLLIGTDGCHDHVVYSSEFAWTKRHDPTRIVLSAPREVRWAIQLWAGTYADSIPLAPII